MLQRTAFVAKPREVACCVCGKWFVQQRMGQEACGVGCARRVPVLARKAEKAQTKARIEALRPLSYWTKQAQDAVNSFVRYRDISAGHGCIDCGRPFPAAGATGGAADAGHYLSRSHAPHLRFDERNIFAQHKHCNRPGVTDPRAFRAGVVARIGLEAVEALEADRTPRQYRAAELQAIRDLYRAKLRELIKEKTT